MRRPRYKLGGRTVLVTGAARGIGAELARRLAERGARLALVGVEPEALEALAVELGPRAAYWQCDVTDRAQVDMAVAAAVDHFGGLDVVVANAGVQAFGTLVDSPPEAFERVLQVNLLGSYRTLRAAVPHVVARKGYVLAMASMAATVQSPLQAHYAASKAGVAAMANSLRLELADTGVGVGVAYPTFVATDMMRQTLADEAGRRLWNGNTGLWSMISLEVAVAGLVEGIERRRGRIVLPRRLTPLVVAPGLFAPLLPKLFPARHVAEVTTAAHPRGR